MSFGAIVAAVGFALGSVSVWQMVAAVVMSAISHSQAAKARRRQKKLEAEAAARADAAKGFTLTVEAQVQHIGIAYGRNMVGGLRTWHGVSSSIIPNGLVGDEIITSSGDIEDIARLTLSANCYSGKVTIYYEFTRNLTYTMNSGQPALWATDPHPPVYNQYRDSNLDNFTVSTLLYDSFFFSSRREVRKLDIVGTLDRSGTVYGIYLTDSPDLRRYLLAGARISLNHDSFFKDSSGNVVPANADVTTGSSLGPGWHDYTITQYYPGSGYLQLSGIDLQFTEAPGTAFLTFASGRYSYKNEALFFKQVLCYEGISDIVAVHVNGEDIHDPVLDMRVHVWYNGGVADPWVTAAFPGEANSHYPGTAHATVICWLNRDDPQFQGVPDVRFIIDGMKVRKATPYGYRESTPVFTSNPAHILVDYLCNTNYGKGLADTDLDLASFYYAGLICDRLVQVGGTFAPGGDGVYWNKKGGRQVHLYECNLVLDSTLSVRDNIEIILETMGEAELIWSSGKYKLQLVYAETWTQYYDYRSLGRFAAPYPVTIGAQRSIDNFEVVQYGTGADVDLYQWIGGGSASPTSFPPVVNGYAWRYFSTHLDDGDILGDTEITTSSSNGKDILNHYTVRFLNEAKDWEEDAVSWPTKYDTGGSATAESNVYKYFLAQDQGVALEANTFASGVTSYAHAKAFAEGVVRGSRNSTVYTFALPRRFIFLEPGDIVKVRSDVLRIEGDLLKITELYVNDDGNMVVTAIRYDVRTLAWNAFDAEVVPPRVVYNTEIGQARNLTFAPTAAIQTPTSGTISWDEPEDGRVVLYAVRIAYIPVTAAADAATSAWTQLGSTTDTSFVLPPLGSREVTVTVIATAANGKTAPRYNLRTGSRWPLLGVQPIDYYAPINVTITPNPVVVPQLSAAGDPGVGVATVSAIRSGEDMATVPHGYSIEEIEKLTDATPALLTDGYAYLTFSGTAISVHLAGTRPPRTGTLVVGIIIENIIFRREVPYTYAGDIFASVIEPTATAPKPASPTVSAGVSFVRVQHEAPSDAFVVVVAGETLEAARAKGGRINGGYAKTEVWGVSGIPGFTPPTIGAAVFLAEFSGQDANVSADSATEYYLWFRWVGVNGTASEFVGPLNVTTSTDPSSLLRALEGGISSDQLAPSVTATLDQAGTNSATLVTHAGLIADNADDIADLVVLTGTHTDDILALADAIADLELLTGTQTASFSALSDAVDANTLLLDTHDDALTTLTASLGTLDARKVIKLDADGFVAGVGTLASAAVYDSGVHDTFVLSANTVEFAASGEAPALVFTVFDVPTDVDGFEVPAGTYLNPDLIMPSAAPSGGGGGTQHDILTVLPVTGPFTGSGSPITGFDTTLESSPTTLVFAEAPAVVYFTVEVDMYRYSHGGPLATSSVALIVDDVWTEMKSVQLYCQTPGRFIFRWVPPGAGSYVISFAAVKRWHTLYQLYEQPTISVAWAVTYF